MIANHRPLVHRPLVFRALVLALGLSIALSLPRPASAQDRYPSRPVRLIVPFPAAGPLDLVARLYAQGLSERWGQPAVVENRTGATGTIGAEAVARAAPDGYTVLLTVDLPIVMAPALIKTPYDPRRDLVPVVAVAESMNMLVVHPSVGVTTLEGLVAAAKARPGALTYSSAGQGSPGHLCAEMLRTRTGIDIVHVPYKGAAPAATAVLAGEVSMFCGPVAQTVANVRAGKLHAVGVTGTTPSPLMPGVAPLSATYPGLVVSNFYGVFVPPGTPAAVVMRLRDDLRAVSEARETSERLSAAGIDPGWIEGPDLARRIDADLTKWTSVVKAANIKPE